MYVRPYPHLHLHRHPAEFINAIRGTEKIKLTTFEDGVAYMEFTEAVYRSMQQKQAIELPLSL